MPTPPPETRSPGPRDPAPTSDERRLAVSGTQVATSALASVSAAFVASLFGVAGTIAGAAVVSVVATVGSAIYGRGIKRTTARLQQVPRRVAVRRGGGAVADPAPDTAVRAAPDSAGRAAPDTGGEPVELEVPAAGPGWWVGLSRRRWGLAAGVATVLVLSVGAVSLVELAGGRPLSGEASGGRTSIGALLPGSAREGDGHGEVEEDDGTDTTTDPTAPTTTAPGARDGGTGGTVPPGSATTSSTVATTTTSTTSTTTPAPPAAQPPAEREVAPDG